MENDADPDTARRGQAAGTDVRHEDTPQSRTPWWLTAEGMARMRATHDELRQLLGLPQGTKQIWDHIHNGERNG